MTRILALPVAAFIAQSLAAQTVFIPDPQFRAKLNQWAPGLVDANGFMPENNAGLHPASFHLSVNWSPADLTGIEALDGAIELTINCASGISLTLDSVGVLSRLELLNYPNPALPGIGAAIYLVIDEAPAITELPNLAIEELVDITLSDMTSLSVTPIIPEGVLGLTLWNYPEAVPMPDLPSTLLFFTSRFNDHATIPDLPDGLESLDIGMMPNVLALPILPASLWNIDLGGMPIETLDASACDADVCALSVLPNLTTVYLGWGGYLEIDALPSLIEVDAGSDATTIWINECPALQSISYGDNVQEMTLNGVPSLASLPGLSSQLNGLLISNSAITQLPELPPALDYLGLAVSPITALGALPESLQQLFLDELPLEVIPALPASLVELHLNTVAATCLPYLPETLTLLELWNMNITCMPNHPQWIGPILPLCTILNSNCPPTAAVLRGRVFRDDNENGVQDPGEPGLPISTISAAPLGYMAGTNGQGDFEIALPIGSHVLTVAVPGPQGSLITPELQPVDAVNPMELIEGIDFAVIMDTTQFDAMVFHITEAVRPGFNSVYTVQAATIGTTLINPQVKLVLEPWFFDTEILYPPGQIDGDTVIWTLPELVIGQPFHGQVRITAPVTTPVASPVLTTATIATLSNDINADNNSHTRYDVVVASFDPNDKQAFPPQLTIAEGADGREVEYLIRFQNTGTFYAERVLITDTLSTDLDPLSFQFLASSHECTWFYQEGALHFLFDPIYLPDSTTNEPESHGFAAFRIRTRPGLLPGHVVPNLANIYFDFNEPVITEPCDLVVELPQFVAAVAAREGFAYPVPTSGMLTLSHGAAWVGASYRLVDATGVQVQQGRVASSNSTIDLGALPQGLYVLLVEAEGLQWSQRVIKE
ncbi:MAG: T9SS type A sorting domain-containing protein [Flavobacteriales bacterium]